MAGYDKAKSYLVALIGRRNSKHFQCSVFFVSLPPEPTGNTALSSPLPHTARTHGFKCYRGDTGMDSPGDLWPMSVFLGGLGALRACLYPQQNKLPLLKGPIL